MTTGVNCRTPGCGCIAPSKDRACIRCSIEASHGPVMARFLKSVLRLVEEIDEPEIELG